MKSHRRTVLTWTTCGLLVGGFCGCTAPMPPKAGRTTDERARLVKPGMFDEGKAAADRRRIFFDFWNEQVIREDVAVGTVFLGDSITELWDLNVYFVPAEGLIENRGISGDLASHMARRFEADVTQLRPRNVVILAGTNDVSAMIRQNRTDEEIIHDVTASVVSMMDASRRAGIHTLVCSILPTNSDYGMHANRTKLRAAINEKLKTACGERGCIYVDYAAAMSDAHGDLRKDLARDGLHPHYAGYEIMARVLNETAARHGLRF